MGSGSGTEKSYTWVVVLFVVLLVALGIFLGIRRTMNAPLESYGGGVPTGRIGGAEPYTLRPAGKGPHTHRANLDHTGTGISTMDHGHRHVVEKAIDIGLEMGGKTVPASHTHDVTQFIVDA
jgi:hypothetical protein